MRKSYSEPQGFGPCRPPPRPSALAFGAAQPPSPSLPTSPTSETSSTVRSTSSSPGRDATRTRLAVAGSRFCIATVSQPPGSQQPNDDIATGRKSPFISSRTWPKGLRTRSASKERIAIRQRAILQHNPVEQINKFQREAKEDIRASRESLDDRGRLSGGGILPINGMSRSSSLATLEVLPPPYSTASLPFPNTGSMLGSRGMSRSSSLALLPRPTLPSQSPPRLPQSYSSVKKTVPASSYRDAIPAIASIPTSYGSMYAQPSSRSLATPTNYSSMSILPSYPAKATNLSSYSSMSTLPTSNSMSTISSYPDKANNLPSYSSMSTLPTSSSMSMLSSYPAKATNPPSNSSMSRLPTSSSMLTPVQLPAQELGRGQEPGDLARPQPGDTSCPPDSPRPSS